MGYSWPTDVCITNDLILVKITELNNRIDEQDVQIATQTQKILQLEGISFHAIALPLISMHVS